MPTASNDSGRALEYRISAQIKSDFPNCTFTKRARADNARDRHHYKNLGSNLQEDFSKCAKIVSEWLEAKIGSRSTSFTLDRLPDSSGTAGDSTDIRIAFGNGRAISLSVKNNYPALKHQRLPRLPRQCGIVDREIIARYKTRHDKAWGAFFKIAKKRRRSAKKFSEIHQIISRSLYLPLTRVVLSFLNENRQAAPSFFRFLTGGSTFYLVKNSKKSVLIFDFANVQAPSSMQAKRVNNSNISVEFDNGWKLNLRLHTASSRMYTASGNENRSVKMDTTFPKIEETVPFETFEKE